MGKFIEIYLAEQDVFQLTHDGATIKVHRGAPPDGPAGVPGVHISDGGDEQAAEAAPTGTEDASNLYIPTNIKPPLNAAMRNGQWNVEPGHEIAHD